MDEQVVLQDLEGSNLDCAMAQHLLVAADRFQLPRLRRICERRLCETVEVPALFCMLSSCILPSGCMCASESVVAHGFELFISWSSSKSSRLE